MRLSTVILAGGQGRRMGGVNKALLKLDERTILERQLRAASAVSDDWLVVGASADTQAAVADGQPVRFVPDRFPGEGPLAGIHAGLTAARHDLVWVLGCDQPFPDPAAILLLRECLGSGSCQAALPVIDGREQPLHALYRKDVALAAENLLKQGERRLTALLRAIPWVGCAADKFAERRIEPIFHEDIDTIDQYDRAKRRVRGEAPGEELQP